MRFFTMCMVLTALLFSVNNFAQVSIDELTTSINGKIISAKINQSAMVSSENGIYFCTYDVLSVTDAMRQIGNFRLYENDNLILMLSKIPGSDLNITNSGKIIFYDHSEHFKGILKIHIYSKDGEFLFSKKFANADGFEFSSSEEIIGVRSSAGINIISLNSKESYLIGNGLQFAIDDKNELVAVASEGNVKIYKNSDLIGTIQNEMNLPRKVIVSSELNKVVVIDKYHLKAFSLDNHNLLFGDNTGGDLSFRDIKFVENKIASGIHKRNQAESTGLLRIYDLNGKILESKSGDSKQLQQFEKLNLNKKTKSDYDPIPWPFFPFDSMRTVWNHYEQHMGMGGVESYLHQGLDIIIPIGEPTYSVIDGFVKCVLTLGGAYYWRIAISDTQIAGRSNGWLSAHLIQNTIQFDIGDTVHIHDYLGNIIDWSYDWGHIHFVNISDSGLVWYYNDDEWGINFNPILALEPYPDTTPPAIEPVFSWSKFAFAKNESDVYLQPDSLFGKIDIIIKVVDYVGDSEWQQPAYTTWYTIKKISDGQIIQPRTLGTILNHKYPFFAVNWFMDYAGVIYQRDNILLPTNWMSEQRNFYHNLTNNNGDSAIMLSEKALAFNTENYEDGDYRIIIEAFDEAGNSDIDSMDVKFRNGNPVNIGNEKETIYSFNLAQNYPNPFNPTTKINWQSPVGSWQILKVYDVLGNEVATLVDEYKPAGKYEVEFSGNDLTSSVYFYRLKSGNFIQTKKMILLR